MRRRPGDFRVRANAAGDGGMAEFVNGQHFAIDPARVSEALQLNMTDAEDDLIRVGMAVYVVDRYVRRSPARADRAAGRELDVEVSVSNPDLWNEQAVNIGQMLQFLGADEWRLRFTRSFESPQCPRFLFPPVPGMSRVCLYSAGLDSLAGLAVRLAETEQPYYAVTARHRSSLPPPLRTQYRLLAHRFGRRVTPVVLPTTLLGAGRLDQQELSQRCRAFLFCAIAGAVASQVGAGEVEVFENGVGALNVPPMNGMLWGGRATRGCHPHFLRRMGALASAVLGRQVSYVLPFKWWTKAEMVRRMSSDGLSQAAASAVSCVHFPRRVSGPAKQCGLCPACIGSQQALIAAGLDLPADRYAHDILNPACNALPLDELADLRQHVLQVSDFHRIAPDGSRPQVLRRHLASTQAITAADPAERWVDLLSRYRDEWMTVADRALLRGCRWPRWLDGCRTAASLVTSGASHE